MSFLGRSISNRFPKWSKIYNDDSSNGGIILDTIGRNLEKFRQTGLNYKKQKRVLEDQFILTYPNSYRIELPNYTYDIDKRIIRSLSWSADGKTLDIYDNWSDYNVSLPSDFKVKKTKLNFLNKIAELEITENVSFSNDVYDFKKEEKSLIIDCREIEYFKNGYTHKNFGMKFSLSGKESIDEKYYIVIRGKDYFNKAIEEVITITKKDVYRTKNKFCKICPLSSESIYVKQRKIIGGPSIECTGFVGKIKVQEYDFGSKEYILKDTISAVSYNPYGSVYPEDSLIENHLKINLINKNQLEYIHSYFNLDYKYLSKNKVGVKEEECIAKVKLFNRFDQEVSLSNYVYDEKRKLIYAIDNDKRLYLYNVERPKLVNRNLIERTKEIDLELITEKNFFSLNEKINISLLISRPKTSINNYYIFKYKPNTRSTETEWAVEFLNDSYEWNTEVHAFNGSDRLDKYENLLSRGFKDVLDEYGQYDYYVVSTNKKIDFTNKINFREKIKFFIKNEIDGFSCNKTSVLVPKAKAIKEYYLTELDELNLLQNETYKISFDKILNRLIILHVNKLYTFEEIGDKLFFNWLEGVAFTQEKYNNLKLKIVYEDNSMYECEISYE